MLQNADDLAFITAVERRQFLNDRHIAVHRSVQIGFRDVDAVLIFQIQKAKAFAVNG